MSLDIEGLTREQAAHFKKLLDDHTKREFGRDKGLLLEVIFISFVIGFTAGMTVYLISN